jgi:hypothetical protein
MLLHMVVTLVPRNEMSLIGVSEILYTSTFDGVFSS